MPASQLPVDDGLALLTGDDAADLLAAAVRTAGGRLVEWYPSEVDCRPGERTTVSYSALVAWPGGEREEMLGATVGGDASSRPPGGDAPGVIRLSDGTVEAAVWLVPYDPGLPSLAAACDPAAIQALLRSFGVDRGPVRCTVRAYRPGRRAVVEVRGDGVRLFLKVVRPGRSADLHARHVLLHDAGVPVPRSLGWTDDGLLVLEALPGSSLREELRAGATRAPSGEDLVALLARFPAAARELPRRPSWSDGALHYAQVVADVLPAESDRALELGGCIDAALAGCEPDADATHGDLYEEQLLIGPDGRLSGLLDVDSAGPGRRADDLACALAHLIVLAQIEPEHAPTTHALAARWAEVFDRHVDPVELRYRAAGVTLSLATGPHRVQDPDWDVATSARLDLVEQWLRSADEDDKSLIFLSRDPHLRRPTCR